MPARRPTPAAAPPAARRESEPGAPVPSGRLVDVLLRVAAVTWGVLVVVLSLTPDDPSAQVAWDKARHAGAYAVLAGLVLLAVVWRPGRRWQPSGASRWKAAAAATAIVVVGGLIEVLQAKVVDRDGSFGDLLADAIGVAAAALAWAAAGVVSRSFESRANRPQ